MKSQPNNKVWVREGPSEEDGGHLSKLYIGRIGLLWQKDLREAKGKTVGQQHSLLWEDDGRDLLVGRH